MAQEALIRHGRAFPDRQVNGHVLDAGGQYQWREDGEYHLFNPATVHKLQAAVRTGSYKIFKDDPSLVNEQSRNLCTLRSLLEFKKVRPVPIEQVESVESIMRRFKSGAMSYGSISKEAHEALAIAKNSIGGKCNTGEGGEDPERYKPLPNGDSKNSAIKQVASGRFGVTPGSCSMNGKIRRVITGHDKNGKAIVIEDGLAPAVRTNPLRPGHISVDLWKTAATPHILHATEPDPTGGPKQIHPLPGGTVFRISEIAPETKAIRNISPEQSKAVFAAMGNANATTAGSEKGRHPFMHRTQTIDYAVVLKGEITMLLDDQDVVLKEGDVVIQRGTNHAWSNRSDKPVLMLYVLIDGQFDEELQGHFGSGGH